MLCIGLIIALILIFDEMRQSKPSKDLKNLTPKISDECNSETEQEILVKIQKREEESEALKKLLINLNEPITNKRKQPK